MPTPDAAPTLFWKRSFGAWLWVPLIGGALIALVGAASFLAPSSSDESRLLVYGNAVRRINVEQTVVLSMTLDAIAQSRSQRRTDLQNVKLRLPQALFADFAFVSLDPSPDETFQTNGGRYFQYTSLPRETTLQLRLYARHPGRRRVRVDFYADEHAPSFFGCTVLIAPAKKETSN